jgi:cold shock CspA family protein
MSARHTGTVKWWNEEKCFGFIAQDGGGQDLFAHFKAIEVVLTPVQEPRNLIQSFVRRS